MTTSLLRDQVLERHLGRLARDLGLAGLAEGFLDALELLDDDRVDLLDVGQDRLVLGDLFDQPSYSSCRSPTDSFVRLARRISRMAFVWAFESSKASINSVRAVSVSLAARMILMTRSMFLIAMIRPSRMWARSRHLRNWNFCAARDDDLCDAE